MEKEKETKKESKKFMMFKIVILVILIIFAGLLWARYISTRGLVVKEYPIKTNLLSEEYDGFKIVHFTDLHFGTTNNIDDVKNIVKKINEQNPDVVVFTGDMFDDNVYLQDENVITLAEEINKIDAKINKYIVPGNHDYDKKDYYKLFIEKTNFKVLTNTYDLVYYNSSIPIVFIGLDDYLMGDPVYKEAFQFLNDSTKDYYKILILHEPDQVDHLNDYTENTEYDFNLAIAGHSHLGQVRLPFIGAVITPTGAKTYYDEHYVLGDNKDLYISGGIGTNKLKVRFLNKPSISVYRFYTK